MSISLLRNVTLSTHDKILELCEGDSSAKSRRTVQQEELRVIYREEFQCTTLLPVHLYSYKEDCPLVRVHRSQGCLNDGSMVIVKAFKGSSADSGRQVRCSLYPLNYLTYGQAFHRECDSTVAEL